MISELESELWLINFILQFASKTDELFILILSSSLKGLSPTEVIEGYEIACKKALEILPDLCCGKLKDLKDVEEVTSVVKASVMSKQYGNEEFFSKLIAQACSKLPPKVNLSWIFGIGR